MNKFNDEGFEEVIRKVMKWYDYDWTTPPFNNNIEQVARMMFLDGCFILYFLQCYADFDMNKMEMRHDTIALVERDLLLLENQLPFPVLQTLIHLTFSDIWTGRELFMIFIVGPLDVPSFETDSVFESFHLLDLLWRNISRRLPSSKEKITSREENMHMYTSRSVNKLKAEGIKCKLLSWRPKD